MSQSEPLTAALLRSILTNGSVLPCSPVRVVADGKVVELVAVKLRCKATEAKCDEGAKPAEVPTVTLVFRTPPA